MLSSYIFYVKYQEVVANFSVLYLHRLVCEGLNKSHFSRVV